MASGENPGSLIRFGVFEVDLEAGELRKGGLKIKLREQPFQVLALLLESGCAAMRLHTKEELCWVRAWGILKEAPSSGSRPSKQWCCS